MPNLLASLDPQPLWLTLKLAALVSLLLLPPGLALAWWLARWNSRWRALFEAVVALPLVLPPVVLGFYLLLLLGPRGPLLPLLRSLGFHGQLTFNFTGLVVGSMVYSLPFMVQPLLRAFEAVPQTLLDAASTLGAGAWDRFFSIALPQARGGLIVALTLCFAHTVGEFGVVLMLGGDIPGQTRVASIAIFDHAEAMEYTQAHVLAAVLLLLALLVLSVVYGLYRKVDSAPLDGETGTPS